MGAKIAELPSWAALLSFFFVPLHAYGDAVADFVAALADSFRIFEGTDLGGATASSVFFMRVRCDLRAAGAAGTTGEGMIRASCGGS